jgi:hypothetical protein
VVSINWGPWDGGLVTPGLTQLFAREGVGTIPLEAGAYLLVNELRGAAGPSGPTEIVVLAPGCKPVPASAPSETAASTPTLPQALPTAFERPLELAEYPVLASHVLDGRPVVPVALLLEWLAHAALVQSPGLVFHGCDDLRVLQGVTLEGPLVVRVGAAKATKREAGLFHAPAEVRSIRPADGREVLHARAEIVLANSLPRTAPPPAFPSLALSTCPHTAEEAYQQGLLFHGPALHGLLRIDGCSELGIAAEVRSAPPVGEWQRQPLRQTWLGDPMALDCAFQMMVLWAQEQRQAGSLPCHVRRYRQYRRAFPASGLRIVARIDRASNLQALADMDFLGPDGQLVARIEGSESIIDPGLARAFRRNELVPV